MISYDCIAELNEIINHPEIVPFHLMPGQEPPLDVTPSFQRGGFGVIGEGYGFLLDPIERGIVEVHTSVLPSHRDKSAAITLESMAEVFIQTEVLEIVTRIRDNRPARMLATHVGMKKTFERDGYEFFSIHLSQWAAKAAQFMAIGEAFHETLEAAGVETNHDHDPNHDHYVGIAIAMAQAGQIGKALWFYNAWARLAGYLPATRTGPDTAFIGNSNIQITPQGVRVV